ncbi:hypothetical protein COCOR_05638 [Corallococcus coralloides DSM 2259]|uniref:Uncharacterized protein n=1 Tax=Corallococcus coralloides (strain ATCC 25202 / DSM 2259 / NBRC 100086 / M2) TaxID=1144275 RepID=H8N242_CORCM|nr:hypothetical protein [Corallococcus coralloides]AFE06489.1 hypothetical protein COCOR_05638 [Corallococcus coralloides DSM 2259]
MDSFFTSLSKRQTMMLLTAVTFGGQESMAALEHLPDEEGALLRHRAQEILQIPREKRLPAVVQELKRLMKDRRGQLWTADPERLAALLQRERGALVEVTLRALPGNMAEAVRGHLPPSRVKLTREVRPQVLDIIRWKLEEALAREVAGQSAGFKFADVLNLQTRELLTVSDRLGARVLGPALAGLPEEELNGLLESLPPDLLQLASKSVAANAPRKLPEEDARAQLTLHDGFTRLAGAIRSAGVQRLARACVAQSPEFAARMLEKHRGEFGHLVAKWVREERSRPTARGDGGRTDIVMDLERLAVRGLIERPVRLTAPPPRPSAVLPPPPGARKPAPAAPGARPEAAGARPTAPGARPGAPAPREGLRTTAPDPSRPPALRAPKALRGAPPDGESADASAKRDFMAERAARRAGAASSRDAGPGAPPAGRPRPAPGEERGSSVGPAPRPSMASREGDANGSQMRRMPVERERGPTPRASMGAPPDGEAGGSQIRRMPVERERGPAPRASMVAPEGDANGSQMRRMPVDRGSSVGPAPRASTGAVPSRRDPEGPRPARPVRQDPDGARIGPPPSRLGARGASRPPEPDAPEGRSVRAERPARPPADAEERAPRRPDPSGEAADGARVLRSRTGSRPAVRPAPGGEPERPPRVLSSQASSSRSSEGTQVGRRRPPPTDRPGPDDAGGPGGRGPRGGTR